MGLREVRKRFFELRESCLIVVKGHAFRDYPERGFSQREIVELVRRGVGRFEENNSTEAIDGSFLFRPKDENGQICKLVILIEVLEIEGEEKAKEEGVIVCSAYRKT